MEKQITYLDLAAHLRMLLESESYSVNTVKDIDFILNAFTAYMAENALDEYTPEIGDHMVRYCEQELHVCASRVSRARVIVRKLNRLQQGLDGRDALWGDKTASIKLPSPLKDILTVYISCCERNGNKETTLHYRQWICGRFLKNLADLGCKTVDDLDDELIQAAFLRLRYSRYWERIGPFLRFLFENGLVKHNYANLIFHRKKHTPHPTVYSPEEIFMVEDSLDRTTPGGIRNYAIILLLSRYGIRSRDVAALTFENFDFINNRIHFVQQKTGVLWEGALFSEVKTALQDYIATARPAVDGCARVFIASTIPHLPIDSYAINTMVWNMFRQSNIAIADRRHGSRAFRSSMASNMVNDNISTEVVRRVLGHGTQYALKYYAKIDIKSMRLCPLPVPAPSGAFAELLSWKEGESRV